MPLNVKGINETERFFRSLSQTSKNVLVETTNELVQQGQSLAADHITEELNITTAAVNDKFTVEKADVKRFTARITAQKRGLSLARFDAEQVWQVSGKKRYRKGVNVRVKKRRKRLAKAFMLTSSKNNAPLVMFRTGKGKKDIKTLYGPSVSQAFETFMPLIERKLKQAYEPTLTKKFNKAIK